MRERVVKEGIIIALLLLVAVYINGVLFYDLGPNNSEDILHKAYVESPEVKDVLARIAGMTTTENSKKANGESIEKYEYTMTEEEKKAGEKHATGKKNPFEKYYSAETEVETKDDKPKEQSEGTFFEKKDKK